MKFNFFNIVILVGAIQSLIFGLLHFFNKRKGVSNKFLGLLLIVIATSNFSFFLFDSKLVPGPPLLFYLTFSFENMIGVFIYLYFKRLLNDQFLLTWKHWYYFLPIFIDISVFISRKGIFGGNVSSLMNQINIYTIVSIITISIISILTLVYNYSKKELLTDTYSWAKKVLITLGLTFFVFLLFRKTFFTNHHLYSLEDNYPFYIIFSVWIYWVGIAAYLKTIMPNKNKQIYNQLSEKETEDYALLFKEKVEVEKLFLDSEITLKKIAKKMEVTSQLLSYVLNTFFAKNFNTIINEYRIVEVKNKIIDPKYNHLSMLGIAFECGFNSKSTFNVVFKKNVEMTPLQFKSLHKVS